MQQQIFFGTKLSQNQLRTIPMLPHESFTKAFAPETWQITPVPGAEEKPETNEDSKLDKITNNKILKLSKKQKEAIGDFIQTVTNETAATLGGIPNFETFSRVSVLDYKNQKGGRCHIALQRGIDSHLIRFGSCVKAQDSGAEEATEIIFGITCLGHVKGLSKEETALIKGLNRWVKDSPIRWMRKQLQNAIRKNLGITEFFSEWQNSFKPGHYDRFQAEMQRIMANPEKLATCYNGVKSVQFAGRTLSACKAAAFLLKNKLPVPFELVRRIELGAKKLR